MKLSLQKHEKLKSKKLIQLLFTEGKQLKVFPVKLLYLKINTTKEVPVQVAFSVPKKNFKKAVSRNHLKRLMREVYRKEKPEVYKALKSPHIFMFIFMGNKTFEYKELEKKMKLLLASFIEKTKEYEASNLE